MQFNLPPTSSMDMMGFMAPQGDINLPKTITPMMPGQQQQDIRLPGAEATDQMAQGAFQDYTQGLASQDAMGGLMGTLAGGMGQPQQQQGPVLAPPPQQMPYQPMPVTELAVPQAPPTAAGLLANPALFGG